MLEGDSIAQMHIACSGIFSRLEIGGASLGFQNLGFLAIFITNINTWTMSNRDATNGRIARKPKF